MIQMSVKSRLICKIFVSEEMQRPTYVACGLWLQELESLLSQLFLLDKTLTVFPGCVYKLDTLSIFLIIVKKTGCLCMC